MIIVGLHLALVYDPQLMRKGIITVPFTITFSYYLPSDPVLRIAFISIYTVVIIGLMLKIDFYKLRFVMKIPFIIIKIFHIVRAASIIVVNSIIIPFLNTVRSVFTTVIIPLIKKTAIFIFTVVIPIFLSGMMLGFNISVTTVIYVQVAAVALTFSCSHLRKEFFCTLVIITTTSTLLIFVRVRPTWDRLDDQFNMMMIVSAISFIIFLCIGLSSDLQFIQKVGLIVVIMNVTIITIEILTMPTNSFSIHSTRDQPLVTAGSMIASVLVILLLAYNYEVIIYILILAACMYLVLYSYS